MGRAFSRILLRPTLTALATVLQRVPEAAVQPEPAAPEVGQSEAAAPGPVKLNLRIQLVSSLDAVGREEWDRCATGSGEVNPFLLWDFLYALEASKSAVKEEGWLAQHVLVRDDDTGELLGCCPLYLKGVATCGQGWEWRRGLLQLLCCAEGF